MKLLLLALLVAAPERVVVVPGAQKTPGVLRKLESAASRAWHRLYEKDDPDVARGNALAAQNDPEGALRAYAGAQERLADSHELHFDRSGAMLKLGAEEAAHAHDEALQAMQSPDRSLKAKAAFHLGLAQEQLGKPDDAIKAYEQALALDPEDADSKVNLELLLKQEERKQKQPQPQKQQSKDKQQDQKQQPDKSKGEEQQKDPQKEAGKNEEQKQKEQQPGPQEQAKPEEKKQQQAEEQKPVDRSEAERLLDALRAGEKNLQVWRFAKDKRKEARRGDVEKDW